MPAMSVMRATLLERGVSPMNMQVVLQTLIAVARVAMIIYYLLRIARGVWKIRKDDKHRKNG